MAEEKIFRSKSAEEKISIPRRKFLKTFLGGTITGSALTSFPILKTGMRIGMKLEQNTPRSQELTIAHDDPVYLREKYELKFTPKEMAAFEEICKRTNSSPFEVRQTLLISMGKVPKEECPISTDLVDVNEEQLNDLKKRSDDIDNALGGKKSSYREFRRISRQKLARVYVTIGSEMEKTAKTLKILQHFVSNFKKPNTPERSIMEKLRVAKFGENPLILGGKRKISL